MIFTCIICWIRICVFSTTMCSNIKPKWHNQIYSTRPNIPPATCITRTLAFRTENNLNRINSRNTRIWRYPLNWLYSFYSTGARVLLQLQCAIYLLYSYLRNEQSQIMEHKYSFSLALSISLWNMYNCGMVNRHFVLVMSSRSWQIKCCFTHFHLLRSFFFPFSSAFEASTAQEQYTNDMLYE